MHACFNCESDSVNKYLSPAHDNKCHEYLPHNSFIIPQYDGLNLSLSDCSISVTDLSLILSNSSISSICNLSNEESWYSQDEPSILLDHQHIPVHISLRSQENHQHQKPHPDRKHSNNITVRRDNKLLEAMSLPVFSVYNMRSIWSKLSSLAEDMDNRDSDIAILSEVWEKKENVRHQNKIVELFELRDTKYFSTARPGAKHGGCCHYSQGKQVLHIKAKH